MKKIFIINGAAGVGKDTFVEIAKHYFLIMLRLPTYNISSVDKVKEAGKTLGWDGVKDEKGRAFLSDLKDLSTRNYQGPYQYMVNEISSKAEGIFFLHIRETNEIEYLIKNYPHDVEIKTLLIKREGVEKFNNHADKYVDLYAYDVIIDNSGTIEELVNKVKDFVNEEL